MRPASRPPGSQWSVFCASHQYFSVVQAELWASAFFSCLNIFNPIGVEPCSHLSSLFFPQWLCIMHFLVLYRLILQFNSQRIFFIIIVFVSSGCQNKMPYTGMASTGEKYTSHSPRGWKPKIEGPADSFSWCGLSCWCSDGHLFALYSQGREGEEADFLVSLFIRPLIPS